MVWALGYDRAKLWHVSEGASAASARESSGEGERAKWAAQLLLKRTPTSYDGGSTPANGGNAAARSCPLSATTA